MSDDLFQPPCAARPVNGLKPVVGAARPETTHAATTLPIERNQRVTILMANWLATTPRGNGWRRMWRRGRISQTLSIRGATRR
jgi:hypothetical protein